MNETKIHTHHTENGALTHRHKLGGSEGAGNMAPVEFLTHQHLIVLSERNFVNEYTSPPTKKKEPVVEWHTQQT